MLLWVVEKRPIQLKSSGILSPEAETFNPLGGGFCFFLEGFGFFS